MADTIEQAARELLEQQMRENPEQFKVRKSSIANKGDETMSPSTLATIGGLADAASTYYFAKTGKAKEDNALIGFTNSHPEATALAALGGLAASKGLTALIRKMSPKAADAIAANLGALQLGYGVENIRKGATPGRASTEIYQNVMTRKAMKDAGGR
jgi:hypothetical protein